MPERWLGVVVSGDKITCIDAEVSDTGPLVLQGDFSWPLQKGDRATAYNVMHQHLRDYVSEHQIHRVVIKESALSRSGTRKAHLLSAELRGVIIAASAGATRTRVIAKANISRTFGGRKVDEYLDDNEFWGNEVSGELRRGSREAAMILLAARKAG